MITEDQTDVVEFLAAPSTHGTETVERIDTHSAGVFLAGDRAYKLKRAVRFDSERPQDLLSEDSK